MAPGPLAAQAALVVSSAGFAPAPDLAAPVAYRDLMLVLVTKDGAAAVVFSPATPDGDQVGYSFRYESANGEKRLSGTGKLFERRLERGGFDPAGLYIEAGSAKVKWSMGNADRGWIYYAPEVVTVHLAHADNFKGRVHKVGPKVVIDQELDLQRFMKK
jgi:hypothetical protein